MQLGGVAVVGCDDAAESSITADGAVYTGPEGNMEYIVLDSVAPVRPLGVVVLDRCPHDVVELSARSDTVYRATILSLRVAQRR